jgi:hypothetical protein
MFAPARHVPSPKLTTAGKAQATDEKGLDFAVTPQPKAPPSREAQLLSQAGKADRQPIAYYGENLMEGLIDCRFPHCEWPRLNGVVVTRNTGYREFKKLLAKRFHKGKPLSVATRKSEPIPVVHVEPVERKSRWQTVNKPLKYQPRSNWHADHGTALGGYTHVDPYAVKKR